MWLAERLLISGAAWSGARMAIEFLAMLPMGLGVCTVFLVSAIVRGAGDGSYDAAWRHWLCGLAAGLAVFGGIWLAGGDILGAAVVAGVALLAAAGVLFVRRPAAVAVEGAAPPVEVGAGRRARVGVAAAFAGVAFVMAGQARLVADLAGLDPGGCALAAAASIALLAALIARADRRVETPGPAQAAGAVAGAAATAGLQAALAVGCLSGDGATAWAYAALAVAAQVPLAGCGALFLSRQRRRFAEAGGRARAYLASAAGGAGAGLAAWAALGAWGQQAAVLPPLATGVVALAVLVGVLSAGGAAAQARWAVCGAILIGAVGASMLVAIRRAGARAPVAAGAWLTAGEGGGLVPAAPPWRSDALGEVAASIVGRREGTWWFVSATGDGLPVDPPRGIAGVATTLDAAFRRERPGRSAAGAGLWLGEGEAGFFRPPARGRGRFDGAFLVLLPADHPQAWRCYSRSALGRAAMRLRRDAHGRVAGPVLLRCRAGRANLGDALAVARTYLEVVGSGWLVGRLDEEGLDMLLVGPEGLLDRPAEEGVPAVSIGDLLRDWPEIGPVRLTRPRGVLRTTVDPQKLARALAGAGAAPGARGARRGGS